MEGLELISFKIIAAVGSARGKFIEAMNLARSGNFKEAEEKMKSGDDDMVLGHKAHMEILTMQANGEEIPFDLLLVHSEDQMMSTETTKIMAEEIIRVYKALLKGEKA